MSSRKPFKNTRTNQLRNILKNKTEKHKFNIIQPSKYFPEQSIFLFPDHENFPGKALRNANPSEYLRQKQKLTARQYLEGTGFLSRFQQREPRIRVYPPPTINTTSSNEETFTDDDPIGMEDSQETIHPLPPIDDLPIATQLFIIFIFAIYLPFLPLFVDPNLKTKKKK